jgi:hypothetical protein
MTTGTPGEKADTRPQSESATAPDTALPSDEHELRQEIEQTREQLAQTVEHLAEKADVKAAARAKAAHATQRMKRPMPMAAVAAMLIAGYLAMRRWAKR